ncbi:hypothetical protein B6A10_13300 [Flavobacterium sp. L1I52]|uniref:Uncharacterized protein n=1 Tax=Flavobacterium pokkalii TaxID=1940408 RepID=A0ABR7UTA7_9FLAO|nr:glycosyltransferase [Flavobacterium pokkalii]MBD0726150.1 hypothetical protein [Flavobacterium pokkalii]
MNILHFNLQKNWRGGEQQLAYLMEYAQKKQYPQTLVCVKGGHLESWAIKEKIPFLSIGTGFWQKIIATFKIKKYIEQQKIDLLHCHESKGHSLALFSKLLFGINCPIIITRRVVFPIKGWFSQKIKYSSKFVSKTICISKAAQDVFEKTTKNKNTTLIYSMTDCSYKFPPSFSIRNRLNLDKETTLVGYIAALTYEKDHNTFLNTAKKILEKNSNIHFILIGNGPMESELKLHAKKLQIEEKIHFLGFINNPKNLIPQIDLLLFTSIKEGLGSTILDFFVAKKPVVTVKNGGSEELVINNKTGFICNPGDTKNLADKTLFLINNKKDREVIIENAYNFVVQNFNIDSVCLQTYNTYHELIKDK